MPQVIFAFLGNNPAGRESRCVDFHTRRTIGRPMGKHRLFRKHALQSFEGFLLWRTPSPRDVLLSQVMQRTGVFTKVLDEPSIEVRTAYKPSKIFKIPRLRPFPDSGNLAGVHRDSTVLNHHA